LSCDGFEGCVKVAPTLLLLVQSGRSKDLWRTFVCHGESFELFEEAQVSGIASG
jgi:hypothetical protein